jgi:protein gp37
MNIPLTIDPEIERLLPPLSPDEFAQLKHNLLNGRAGTITLTVWKERGVLLDGYNRYKLCRQHGLKFSVDRISLPDLDAAKRWVLSYQLGRRNLTAEQASYLRGKQAEAEKSRRDIPKEYSNIQDRLARSHHVTQGAISKDAKFARSVDAIASAAGPEARQTILARDTKLGRQEVHKLADIARSQPQTARNVLAQVEAAPKPKEAKRLVHQAAKQLPELAPQPPLAAPSLAGKTLEELDLKGGKGYIARDPRSEPVFNRTNEMVDWASWTWNPVTGCWHGCDYCYARAIANDERMAAVYPKKFEPVFHEARLDAPKNTPFPKTLERPQDRNVFTCSMADLFGKWVPDEWILRVFERVEQHPEWNFLFLTKFPQRLSQIGSDLGGFPDNAWVGCTVDGQSRVRTAEEAFAGLRAKVRWLSVEPMQERLTFRELSMFDWLVVGGKSASAFNGTPEGQPEWEWVEHLWRQARAAGLRIYWKENLKVKPKEVPW